MSYTVAAVTDTRNWESKYGPMISYVCTLTGPDGKANLGVEVAQKETTKPITTGDVLEGTIDWEGKFGPKFKKEQPQRGRAGYAGGGGGGSRPRDPGERNSIERQVALKAAVELVNGIGSAGISKLDFDYTKMLLTGFFEQSLALIQDAPKPDTTQARAPQTPTPVASNGGKSPSDHAFDALRDAYASWAGDDPDAPMVWQNKLTMMGLKAPQEASDDQLTELFDFLGASS